MPFWPTAADRTYLQAPGSPPRKPMDRQRLGMSLDKGVSEMGVSSSPPTFPILLLLIYTLPYFSDFFFLVSFDATAFRRPCSPAWVPHVICPPGPPAPPAPSCCCFCLECRGQLSHGEGPGCLQGKALQAAHRCTDSRPSPLNSFSVLSFQHRNDE